MCMCRQIIRLKVVCVQKVCMYWYVLHEPETVRDQELRAPQTLQIQDAQLTQY